MAHNSHNNHGQQQDLRKVLAAISLMHFKELVVIEREHAKELQRLSSAVTPDDTLKIKISLGGINEPQRATPKERARALGKLARELPANSGGLFDPTIGSCTVEVKLLRYTALREASKVLGLHLEII